MKLLARTGGTHGLSVKVFRDSDGGYSVQLLGAPQGAPCTYSTDSECDALRTAQWMLGDAQVLAALVERSRFGLQKFAAAAHCQAKEDA